MRSWKLFSKQILWIWESRGTHAHPLRLLFHWCLEHFRQPCYITTVEKQLVDCLYLQTSMPVLKHKRGDGRRQINRSPSRIPGRQGLRRGWCISCEPIFRSGHWGVRSYITSLLPFFLQGSNEGGRHLQSFRVFSRCERCWEGRDCPVGSPYHACRNLGPSSSLKKSSGMQFWSSCTNKTSPDFKSDIGPPIFSTLK